MSTYSLFTSESVSEGHPDKIADQISDAILDAIIAQDKDCRVACETLIKTGMVLLAGEIRTSAWVDIEEIARSTILKIGYVDPEMGFDHASCAILTAIGKQSGDIAKGVDKSKLSEQGAGDQGLMFGYATNETDTSMPVPIYLAHRLMRRQSDIRHKNELAWLRPDAKSQVTVRYANNKPVGIDCVVLSVQHHPSVKQSELKEAVMEMIIKPVLPAGWLDKNTVYHINPTGRFVVGGPLGDCGLTGRKIIVDTYGGMARHGGGCFSGKDPSKVDRSAAYMSRYIAKNIVAAGLADRCEVQVSYAIGIAHPTSVSVNSFGTGKIADDKIASLVKEHFDLRPHHIIKKLNLLRPIYQNTATYGHFGRTEPTFTWEHTDKAAALRATSGLSNHTPVEYSEKGMRKHHE